VSTRASKALDWLDAAFQDRYDRGRADALEEATVLRVEGDHIRLRVGEQTVAVAAFLPPLYQDLAIVSHVPVMLFLASGRPRSKLTTEERAELENIRERCVVLSSRLSPKAGRLADVQEALLAHCAVYADEILETGRWPKEADRTRFARTAGPYVEKNLATGALAHLRGLHRAVGRMKRVAADLGIDWASVHVLIAGGHMQRTGCVSLQYFVHADLRRWTKEPVQPRRVQGKLETAQTRLVYAENMENPAAADRLLASELVDEGISEAFFGDPGRIHEDLMGPAAEWLLAERLLEAEEPSLPATLWKET
jgi:hypothetical protein